MWLDAVSEDSKISARTPRHQNAAPPLLFLVAAVGLGWYVAGPGAQNAFDDAVVVFIKSWRRPFVDELMLLATYLCSWPVISMGATAAAIFWVAQREWLWLSALAASLGLNALLNSTVKHLVNRARPDQAIALLPATGPSFPSGHTFSAFALYGVLALFVAVSLKSGRGRTIVCGLGATGIALVGVSRIYLGAHWPTDVLGSCLFGAAWLLTIADLLARLRGGEDGRAPAKHKLAGVLIVAWACTAVGYSFVHPITETASAFGETRTSATDAPPS